MARPRLAKVGRTYKPEPTSTPVEVAQRRLSFFPTIENEVERMLASEELYAISKLDAFKKRFEENPYNAFEWGQDTIEAAAALEICRIIRNSLHFGIPVIHQQMVEEHKRHARDLRASSSSLSNNSKDCYLRQYTKFLESIEKTLQSRNECIGLLYAEAEGY